MTNRLEVSGLAIATEARLLVEDVHFTVPLGAVHAVLGESGSGKTLTMLAVLGLLPPGVRIVSGSILFYRDGLEPVDLAHASKREWGELRGRGISAVFQNPLLSLNPRQAVGEAVEEFLRVRGGFTRRDARSKSEAWFAKLRITPPENRYASFPRELSGGLLQRVCIALAAALDPMLIVADEPTSALDANLRNHVADLFAGMPSGPSLPSVLFVTHDPGLALRIAPTATLLRLGRQEGTGALSELIRDNEYARFLFHASVRLGDRRSRLPEWEEAASAF